MVTFFLSFFGIFSFTNDLLGSLVIKTEDLFIKSDPSVEEYLAVKQAEYDLIRIESSKDETLRTIEMDDLNPILLYKSSNPNSKFGLIEKSKLMLMHTIENSVYKNIESRNDKICIAMSQTDSSCSNERIRSIL